MKYKKHVNISVFYVSDKVRGHCRTCGLTTVQMLYFHINLWLRQSRKLLKSVNIWSSYSQR